MKLDPWSYSERGTEHSEQVALFSWCNMAANFGLDLASDPNSYNMKGYAASASKKDQPQPLLKRLFAIHNQGHGDAIRGARASAEGVKTGVPDMCLPISKELTTEKGYPVAGYDGYRACGLYIELKRKSAKGKAKGSTSEKQNDWLDFLIDQGYVATVCYGWEEARDVILEYLDLK